MRQQGNRAAAGPTFIDRGDGGCRSL